MAACHTVELSNAEEAIVVMPESPRPASTEDSPSDRLTARPLDAFAHLVGSLRRIKVKQARLARERADHEAVLKAALIAAGAQIGTLAGVPAVSFTSTHRIALSQKILKQRYPEIVDECSDITEVATFRLLDA